MTTQLGRVVYRAKARWFDDVSSNDEIASLEVPREEWAALAAVAHVTVDENAGWVLRVTKNTCACPEIQADDYAVYDDSDSHVVFVRLGG